MVDLFELITARLADADRSFCPARASFFDV
jgi:hypothetical protein